MDDTLSLITGADSEPATVRRIHGTAARIVRMSSAEKFTVVHNNIMEVLPVHVW